MLFYICIVLIFLGMMGMAIDVFIPLTPASMQLVGISNLFGLMLVFIGALVLGVRGYQTRVTPLFNLPSSNQVVLFHQRRGGNPNKTVKTGKLLDLEYIKSGNKLFKDTGGGFRIAGHDCRNTHETISFDIPDWMMDYFYQVKQKYGLRNSDEWKKLMKKLKKLKKPVTGETDTTLKNQLENIKLLQPIMNDPEKRKQLLGLGYDKIKNLGVLCCDGMTHHGEEVEAFIESATPNELDALTKQKYLNDRMKESNYKNPNESFDYSKLVPIAIGMFIAILGTIVFMSYMGGA